MVQAHASERAAVSAWGWAQVFATGSASVEAHEFAVVVAGGTTHVRAFGTTMVRAMGRAQVEAGPGVAVLPHGPNVGLSGEHTGKAVRFRTATEWCDYYGVEVSDGIAILYKAVDDNFDSYHGTSYRPGTEPQAEDWDGGRDECGGGLHFTSQPTFAVPTTDDATRFVACPVRLDDIVVHPKSVYPSKVKARGVCAPVYEVSASGAPVPH
jgi:hypothetical protein